MESSVLPKPRTRTIALWKLNKMIEEGEVFVDAPYQRDIVWNAEKMGDLVDSVLNNYYIPPLLFAVRLAVNGKFIRVVIDGKQRLAAIRRFMKNLVAYVDTSSGKTINRYYLDDPTISENDTEAERALRNNIKPTHFLTPEQFDTFNDFEFVAVEYADIAEEDEFNIFSRVQLGISLSSADKLKATNTPLAALCRQLAKEFQPLVKALSKKADSELFKAIALSYYSVAVEPKYFRSVNLQKFLAEDKAPNADIVERLRRALGIMKSIAANEPTVFNRHDNRHVAFKMIEFVSFARYIMMIARPRLMENFIGDFLNIRRYFYEKSDNNRFYFSASRWQDICRWLDEYVQKNGLNQTLAPSNYTKNNNNSVDTIVYGNNIPPTITTTPQVVANVVGADRLAHKIFNSDDDLSDDLSDEYETGNNAVSTVPFKRRHVSVGVEPGSHPFGGRPVARRGGMGSHRSSHFHSSRNSAPTTQHF
ncbi:hypothetical protein BDF20DRAFT_855246 [Mycotypha africana]|uniref:uncharacterized protein n=1 Tax=Mycotypha africana TaxID=64632 RepID=UPI002301B180|nr:uncharacterized protein BDF20DRAFT_855246 [Mycotypha africana]KAI8988352.1 hypothetical protein BDF20DRAFT_855246 [Mycotypha africana]